ncbi:hypothetical protein ACHAXS_013365 [Conticribra weissflogii]
MIDGARQRRPVRREKLVNVAEDGSGGLMSPNGYEADEKAIASMYANRWFFQCISVSFIALFICYQLCDDELRGRILQNYLGADKSPSRESIIFGNRLMDIATQVKQWRTDCNESIIWLRLIGPEVYAFPPMFISIDDAIKEPLNVDEKISSLMPGKYRVELTLLQCGNNVDGKIGRGESSGRTDNCFRESHIEIEGTEPTSRILQWSWVYYPKCGDGSRSNHCGELNYNNQNFGSKQEDFVFMEVNRRTQQPISENGIVNLKDGINALSRPSSLAQSDSSMLKYFGDLTNYELVCWLGDTDAERYRSAFLKLYPLMGARSQRPFKFHYLTLSDMTDPIKDFSQTSHQTFFKCKIFFISYGIDQLITGVSPKSYRKQVERLLQNIEKSHPDKTFPAWFLTSRSTTQIPKNSCQDESELRGQTPHRVHQYNEEIRGLFHDKKASSEFESRIHLMDNTDLTESFWSMRDNQHDFDVMETQITSAVAMRCMEKVAEQVKFWREINQKGMVQGLMRNGTLTPNPEFVQYIWS